MRVIAAMRQEAIAHAAVSATDATGVLVQNPGACRRGHFSVAIADHDHVFLHYRRRPAATGQQPERARAEGLAELRLAGIEIGLGVDGLSEKPGAEIPANEAPVIGGGALAPQGLEFGGSAVVNWDYQIRNKGVALGLGDHTAVLLRGWSSSTNVVFTAASCNHGACAGASSMNTHCTMSGFRTDDGTHTRYFYSEPSGSTSQVSGGCSTEYGWDSGKNQHNCNDDAELQRDAIYNDSWQSTTAGPCSTRGFHNWSPGCH
ncbi:hypothetical protein WMF27_31160 [Sorangium sp. So ce281]|uniref:hypothetical protein n=1 Tax=unclassified Sorangium TaxID=2621164 RepID=UPI003F5EBC2A